MYDLSGKVRLLNAIRLHNRSCGLLIPLLLRILRTGDLLVTNFAKDCQAESQPFGGDFPSSSLVNLFSFLWADTILGITLRTNWRIRYSKRFSSQAGVPLTGDSPRKWVWGGIGQGKFRKGAPGAEAPGNRAGFFANDDSNERHSEGSRHLTGDRLKGPAGASRYRREDPAAGSGAGQRAGLPAQLPRSQPGYGTLQSEWSRRIQPAFPNLSLT